MTRHAIEQAEKRYGIILNFEDLRVILNKISEGEAKEVKKPKNILGLEGPGKQYNLRYYGKLIQAVVIEGRIVTFNPVGKRESWHKTQEEKTSNDYKFMKKRKK